MRKKVLSIFIMAAIVITNVLSIFAQESITEELDKPITVEQDAPILDVETPINVD